MSRPKLQQISKSVPAATQFSLANPLKARIGPLRLLHALLQLRARGTARVRCGLGLGARLVSRGHLLLGA